MRPVVFSKGNGRYFGAERPGLAEAWSPPDVDEKRFILAEPTMERERSEGSPIPNIRVPASLRPSLKELPRHGVKQV